MKEIPEFICRKKEKQISFSFEDITYYVQSFYSFLEVVVNKVYIIDLLNYLLRYFGIHFHFKISNPH